MNFRRSILDHFKVLPGPWRGPEFNRRKKQVVEAFDDSLFLAISGPIGSGKTELVSQVAQDATRNPLNKVVWLQSKANDKLHISTIIRAFITELGDDRPRRDTEAAARQLCGLLGLAVVHNKQNITLVIDDAQDLHASTINGLKRLRELRFMGRAELFGVVLVGQPKLAEKLQNKSLRETAVRIELDLMDEANGWMGQVMREQYIKDRWPRILTKFQLEQIAATIKTPAAIDQYIYGAMQKAFKRGDTALDNGDFILDPKTIREALQLSQRQLAQKVGLSPATINLVEAGRYENPETVAAVKQKLADLLAEQTADEHRKVS
jgi:type II secretory pathway predicted ATPase ExeA/DNA-binding XRE family transcriptional regulator